MEIWTQIVRGGSGVGGEKAQERGGSEGVQYLLCIHELFHKIGATVV